ncbi:MAG: LamG-like jellyroll fold domain-containing protein [Pirellulales bacterium]
MNDQPNLSPEFKRLLTELIDGKLDAAGRIELCNFLRDNPAAQDSYCKLMAVHALLQLDFGSRPQFALPPVLAGQASASLAGASGSCAPCADVIAQIDAHLDSADDYSTSPSDHDRSLVRLPRSSRSLLFGLAAVAASLLFMVWLLSPLQMRQIRAREAAREEFAQNDVRGVAVLAQSADADWGGSEHAPQVGTPLPVGRFKLERGLAQIEFLSGATVVVEAPADFQLASPMKLTCNLGRMRANVPSQAHGFTIDTPKYSAIDLGTEFTVQVDDRGESEIHVLEGEVELWDRQSAQAELKQLLTTGRGMRSDSGGGLTPIVNSVSNFPGSEQVLQLSQAERKQRFSEWQAFSNKLRKNPDVIAYYGFDNHEAWERVLRNEGPNENELLDGAIVGCHWTAGRWSGKQALEFKRTTDRVRLNVPGEFESLTFAAWVRIEGLERWLSSLMLTDGHDLGEVHWQITELGQLMLGVKAEVEQSHDFYSPSVLSPRDLGRWVHLACVYNGAEGYVAHFLDGEEVSHEDLRRPTTLRIGAAEIGNWMPEDFLDNRVRSLNGRIDEFLIFDKPLSRGEIREMYAAGTVQ